MQIFILNRQQLANATTWISSISSALSGFLRRTNTLSNALLNVSAHYDISNHMFAAFLSEDMTYSCPIWLSTNDPMSREETLQDAQERKLDKIIENARIKSTDHVLEIGTGWGSFAIRAVEKLDSPIA
jgi:cyclopropane-fatty-acyl-phospholipid synthase